MSFHVCKCGNEYHLRYPGITEEESQAVADKINSGALYISDDTRQLMNFYSVTSVLALVEMQAKHIERLQAKLPPIRDTQPGRVRKG
jgi:hypothetical protein